MIADKLVEDGECDEQQLLANRNVGESLNNQCLNISKQFAAYLKKSFPPVVFNNTTPDSLTAMTSLVSKMADVLQSIKSSLSGLERLSVPTYDGSRRSHPTWKKEFNHWMDKYAQNKDKQLQRFRKAMPANFWWTDQVKTCKSIDHAWEILDVEFAHK